ncbi:MAG: GNAT family N-acetyltransferase [Fermentimonas sp.]|jgi:diamine N-acetyltransferase
MSKLLENDMIRLRAPEPEDLEQFYRWENDTDSWTLGATTAPFSRFTLKQYLIESQHDPYSDKQLRLMIELKDSGEAIGTVDLYDFDPFHRRAGVGILIDQAYREQGFGYQTLKLLEAYAFTFLDLHQLYAVVSHDNHASTRLFQKAGYVPAGQLVDWLSTGGEFKDAVLLQKINH